jgi:hypothetical protein
LSQHSITSFPKSHVQIARAFSVGVKRPPVLISLVRDNAAAQGDFGPFGQILLHGLTEPPKAPPVAVKPEANYALENILFCHLIDIFSHLQCSIFKQAFIALNWLHNKHSL